MQDRDYIARCIEIAKQGELYVAPNPMVGCVIVHNGNIVAEGYHERYGEAHAEVNAFASLPKHIDSSECTVYVSLEPCSHYGKTPPCADLLVSKEPKLVVIGMLDPNKKVAGRGIKKLLEAGIDMRVGINEEACKELNRKFVKAHQENRPYVTLKWAETNDGYIARAFEDKSSAKISNSLNDSYVHQLRASHQAILVGAGTVNKDNPLLDVRHSEGNSPIKVILSPQLSVNIDSQLFKSGKTLVYNSLKEDITEFFELIKLDNWNLGKVLDNLNERGIHSILVEGGPTIIQAFIDAKEWDEAIILKSVKDWEVGVKAPWIGIPSVNEILTNNDIIKYFKPQ